MSVAGGGNTTSVILNETCYERYSIFFGIPYLLFPDRLTSPTNPITGIRDDNIQLEGRGGGEREREGGKMEIIIYFYVFTLNIVLSFSAHKVSGAAGSEGGK